MSRRPTASIVASPVLVGAVTLLVTIVAVFLAYNANQGLPFVPTYDLSAEVPGGQNLVRGNDVRIGGFRVGVVEDIRPRVVEENGRARSIAVIDLKLDEVVDPLPRDSVITVRPRSALGLKYVEIQPGKQRGGFVAGSTIPLAQSRERVEFDDFLATFDDDLRINSRTALEGFGDALAGRGVELNRAIGALRPFLTHLEPVMDTLNDPEVELDEFFRQIGRAAGEVAPVARVQAQLFTDMADTFEAFSACPDCLRATIERSEPTMNTAISSFRVQRPFLADFTTLSRKLRPAARVLPRSLPIINTALREGQPVLRRTVSLNEDTEATLGELDRLAENPNTLLTLKDIDTAFTVATPLLEFVGPYQTVCNYWNYWWTYLAEHLSATIPGGTYQRQLLNSTSDGEAQDNRINNYEGDRPADAPLNRDPIYDTDENGDPLQVLHTQVYQPAIDAQGNADCQLGQVGWVRGPILDVEPEQARFGRAADEEVTQHQNATPSEEWYKNEAGGTWTSLGGDTPGLAGNTYVGRKLGIRSLRDVDRLLGEE
jgi:virulence factor Mce-like protein